jgi:hypothetical protein
MTCLSLSLSLLQDRTPTLELHPPTRVLPIDTSETYNRFCIAEKESSEPVLRFAVDESSRPICWDEASSPPLRRVISRAHRRLGTKRSAPRAPATRPPNRRRNYLAQQSAKRLTRINTFRINDRSSAVRFAASAPPGAGAARSNLHLPAWPGLGAEAAAPYLR